MDVLVMWKLTVFQNITHKKAEGQLLIVETISELVAHLMLMDFSGNVLLERPLNRQVVEQLDLSSYIKGLYYLKVIQHESVQVKRVVVE